MASTLEKVRNLFLRSGSSSCDEDVEPQLGFKVVHHLLRGELVVKVIGGRNLPGNYGNVKPRGYLVKVKVFPGREKYETDIVKESSPCYNQEFRFPLKGDLVGKFVTLTVYAILAQEERKSRLSKRSSFKDHIEAFVGGKQGGEIKRGDIVRSSSQRFTLNNRRTVGAVTYNLERSAFKVDVRDGGKATPDVWRVVRQISSGMVTESKESKKGRLEITMCYSNSEDGKNDMVQVSLSKLRCSMQTMQEHERLGGSLYLKMATYECDVQVAKWKGDTFVPTISMKIEENSATMQATVNNYNRDSVRVVIKLKCRNSLAKKVEVGRIEVCGDSAIWREIVGAPTIPVTAMLDFE